ncbi:hypothetical protein S245_064217, partial [Arachis hypogaea]
EFEWFWSCGFINSQFIRIYLYNYTIHISISRCNFEVWAIADSKRQRYLGFVEFIIAMQLISLAQSGQPITQDLLSSGVELKNLKPPTIDGLDVLIAKKRHKEKEVDSNGDLFPLLLNMGIFEDLHGDLKQARYALQMAGVLSSDGQDLWTGGET